MERKLQLQILFEFLDFYKLRCYTQKQFANELLGVIDFMTENSFVTLGVQVKKLIEKMSEDVAKKYDLRPVELDILIFLTEYGDADTAKDIMQKRHISKSHISKSIDNLSKKGFIYLNEDKDDKRKMHIELKPAAYEIIPQVKQIRQTCRDIIFQGIPEEKCDEIKEILKQISGNVFSALEKD